jgi:hypothetical protein
MLGNLLECISRHSWYSITYFIHSLISQWYKTGKSSSLKSSKYSFNLVLFSFHITSVKWPWNPTSLLCTLKKYERQTAPCSAYIGHLSPMWNFLHKPQSPQSWQQMWDVTFQNQSTYCQYSKCSLSHNVGKVCKLGSCSSFQMCI